MTNIDDLNRLCGELSDLKSAIAVLEWDQQVNMPEAGEDARASQLALFSRMEHELATSDRMGELLEELKPYYASCDAGSDDYCMLRILYRDYEREKKVPGAFVEEFSGVTARAFGNWSRAKAAGNFSLFRDDLAKIFDLRREYAGFFEPYEHCYDPLLDEFEPGMRTADVLTIFRELREGQVALLREIADRPQVDDSFLHDTFADEAQWKLGVEAATRIGFDWTRGRLDRAEHPFTTTFSLGDVRITTHIYEQNMLSALYSTMHEGGHALYEQGVARHLDRTPSGTGASLAIHESQSRLWENLVGRSREFLDGFFPEIRRAFPQLGGVSAEAFYRAANKVEPSLIRTEADEATYNLHIMLRMELEIALLEKNLSVDELPEAWRAKMSEYLGVTPENDRDGVLQDVHWATGAIGYFPTYALGNVFSAQVWQMANRAIPELPDQLRANNFAPLREYLTETLYRHGAKYTPAELIRMTTGGNLDAKCYLKYLRTKFGGIYGLER